jgi:hypothetical protein
MGVKYTNNEAYFDLIEEIDAIIDRNGVTIMCEIQGYVSENNIYGYCATRKSIYFNNNNNIYLKNPKRLRYSFEIYNFLLKISVVMSREDAKNLSDGMETGITWRKVGILHRATNEVLVDIIESLDAIIDQRGMIVNAEVSGVVRIDIYLHNAK